MNTQTAGDRISHEPGKSPDVIAKVDLVRITPTGGRLTISATIAPPYKTLDGFWRVPIKLTGGVGDPSPEIYGVDSFQALSKAVENIRQWLISQIDKEDKVIAIDGNEISPNEYFKIS